jgi:lysophospholipase L1-like esterase
MKKRFSAWRPGNDMSANCEKATEKLCIVTVLGDSLVVPRIELPYSETYPYKLSMMLGSEFLIVNKARRNNTIEEQTSEAGAGYLTEDVEYMKESCYFVVHIGICDCAPRVFSRRQNLMLQKMPLIGKPIIDFKSKFRRFFTKNFPMVYVSKKDFEKKLDLLIRTIFAKTSARKVFVINIADTTKENKYRSYGFEKNLSNYNKIITDVSSKFSDRIDIFDTYSLTTKHPELLWEDGIHIKKEAHDVIAQYLYNKIKQDQRTIRS